VSEEHPITYAGRVISPPVMNPHLDLAMSRAAVFRTKQSWTPTPSPFWYDLLKFLAEPLKYGLPNITIAVSGQHRCYFAVYEGCYLGRMSSDFGGNEWDFYGDCCQWQSRMFRKAKIMHDGYNPHTAEREE